MRSSWHYPTGFRSSKLNLTNLTPYLAASFQKTTHSRSYAIGRPPLTPEEPEKRKKERIKKANGRRRKYATDPEFRARILQQSKQKYADDSEFRERHLRQKLFKWHTDAGFREKQSQINAERRSRYKLTGESEARDLRTERARESSSSRYKNDSRYQWTKLFRMRLQSPRFREEVLWNAHEPVIFSQKMDYRCATCGKRRYRGLKLWWRRKRHDKDEIRGEGEREIGNQRQEGDGEFDCLNCFVADCAAFTPIYYPPGIKPLPERTFEEQPKENSDMKSSKIRWGTKCQPETYLNQLHDTGPSSQKKGTSTSQKCYQPQNPNFYEQRTYSSTPIVTEYIRMYSRLH